MSLMGLIFLVLVVSAFALSARPGGRDLNDRDRRGWWPGSR
jgi:hypothetical protein